MFQGFPKKSKTILFNSLEHCAMAHGLLPGGLMGVLSSPKGTRRDYFRCNWYTKLLFFSTPPFNLEFADFSLLKRKTFHFKENISIAL